MNRLSVLLLFVGSMLSMTACKWDGDSRIRLFSNKDGIHDVPAFENISAIIATMIIDRYFAAQETEIFDMTPNDKTMALKEHQGYGHITTNDSIRNIVNHPAFKGFSPLLLPRENDAYYYETPLSNVRSLMPYHGHVNPDIVVAALNYMIDEVNDGKTIFYDFYTKQQKQADPSKEHTGLFFFRGKPGAPFAIVCPGGGFSYVGSLHEGFPLALDISKKKV